MAKAQKPRHDRRGGRHIPQRTCIACRQTQGKREFVRIVRTPAGAVQIDPTGKQVGRGAYLCHTKACWDQALSGQRLSAALKTTVSPQDLAALKIYADGLAETTGAGDPVQRSSNTVHLPGDRSG